MHYHLLSLSFKVVEESLSFNGSASFTQETYVDELGRKFIVFFFRVTFYWNLCGWDESHVTVLLRRGWLRLAHKNLNDQTGVNDVELNNAGTSLVFATDFECDSVIFDNFKKRQRFSLDYSVSVVSWGNALQNGFKFPDFKVGLLELLLAIMYFGYFSFF